MLFLRPLVLPTHPKAHTYTLTHTRKETTQAYTPHIHRTWQLIHRVEEKESIYHDSELCTKSRKQGQ